MNECDARSGASLTVVSVCWMLFFFLGMPLPYLAGTLQREHRKLTSSRVEIGLRSNNLFDDSGGTCCQVSA